MIGKTETCFRVGSIVMFQYKAGGCYSSFMRVAFDWGVIFHNHRNTVYKLNISENEPNEAGKTKDPQSDFM